MISYVNTHFALEKLRDEAAAAGREGPRVLVVGPNNAGKTSLVKLLTAYAMRMGRQPVVVNTDSREGVLSVPGSLTAATFASIADVEQGWGSSPTSASTPVPVKLPLCYYYGLGSPEDAPRLWKPVVSRLALAVRGRVQDDKEVRKAGVIVDTAGVISQGKNGYELIGHLVAEFSSKISSFFAGSELTIVVNVVLVLGSERVYSDLQKRFATIRTPANESIEVIKLDKSGGCVDRDDAFLQHLLAISLKEYFFGDAKTTLSPHTQMISFDDITIYRLKEGKVVTPPCSM